MSLWDVFFEKGMFMIFFVAGVHGVGKSFLCSAFALKSSILHKSASQLIKDNSEVELSVDKKTKNVESNQEILVKAVKAIHANNESLLLDGHFVLVNDGGNIVNIDIDVFSKLNLDGIILIEVPPHVIEERIAKRDGGCVGYDLRQMIVAERKQAQRVSTVFNIPLVILQEPSHMEFEQAITKIPYKE